MFADFSLVVTILLLFMKFLVYKTNFFEKKNYKISVNLLSCLNFPCFPDFNPPNSSILFIFLFLLLEDMKNQYKIN